MADVDRFELGDTQAPELVQRSGQAVVYLADVSNEGDRVDWPISAQDAERLFRLLAEDDPEFEWVLVLERRRAD